MTNLKILKTHFIGPSVHQTPLQSFIAFSMDICIMLITERCVLTEGIGEAVSERERYHIHVCEGDCDKFGRRWFG